MWDVRQSLIHRVNKLIVNNFTTIGGHFYGSIECYAKIILYEE